MYIITEANRFISEYNTPNAATIVKAELLVTRYVLHMPRGLSNSAELFTMEAGNQVRTCPITYRKSVMVLMYFSMF